MGNRVLIGAALAIAGMAGAGTAAARPVVMPTLAKEIQLQKAAYQHELAADQGQAAGAQGSGGALNPPAPPCPENGLWYPNPTPVSPPIYPLGNCGIGQPPATTVPWLGNMAYYGGHVEVHPHVYLVYWGWGASGGKDPSSGKPATAFPGHTCAPKTFSEGRIRVTLPCDPDGAGKYTADFVSQMGATKWAGVSTQYYQTDSRGNRTYISNDKNVLAGIWADNTNDITPILKSNATNPAGPTNTYTMLAREATRAAAHFRVTGAALSDANFVILQPPGYSDPNALNAGYCAFHDYTEAKTPGNFYYDPKTGVQQHIAYTNMPYVLAINFPYTVDNQGGSVFMGNSRPENVCGQNAVNPGKAGLLDGFSIALGHEIEETITDPGSESNVGQLASVSYAGGWYSATDPSENGDKCAWVGEPITASAGIQLPQGAPNELPVPGSMADITGNAGGRFAVQSLWSNADNAGTGYCAGAGTDSPLAAAAYGSSPAKSSSATSSRSGRGSASRGTSNLKSSSSRHQAHRTARHARRKAHHKAKRHAHGRRATKRR